ncbi:MAG: flavin-containing monooxygenase [Solirubrobacteraceae bacterium]
MTDSVAPAKEHVDVLIVGAGLSGIGAGYHLQTNFPGKSYAILEAREAIGGTWDLFRFPGVRSDSDMFTLGYHFRPWRSDKAIGDGQSILDYIRETASAYGIERKIHFNHRVVSAQWSTDEARWTVTAQRTDTGETVTFTAGFLFMCSGYYRYDQGYLPDFPGIDRFKGQIAHPQFWSDDVDYAGKRVVVIGSGATAVTMIPAMADDAEHVTMLQRSPSYVISLPGEDPVARVLRKILPAKLAYSIVRWKNVLFMMGIFQLSRRRPKAMKSLIRKAQEKALPPGFDIDTHFNPSYDPWDQRMCLVPDNDLFESIASGKVSVVTDRIKTFTETGLELESGAQLDADLIVTATGLNLLVLGGIELSVDGDRVVVPESMSYKGVMLGGVPNFAFTFGYTNSSWTLRADLVSQYVCRLLEHMDSHGYRQCTPTNRDVSISTEPFIDLTSGYVTRAVSQFPRQGSRAPWRQYQNYMLDMATLRYRTVDDGVLEFSGAATTPAQQPEQVAA